MRATPGAHQVVGNPGAAAASAWQLTTPVADTIVVFEGTASSHLSWSPPSWVRAQPAGKISNLVYSTPSQNTMRQEVCSRSKSLGAGYMYVTDDALPTPWDTLPAYLDERDHSLPLNCTR